MKELSARSWLYATMALLAMAAGGVGGAAFSLWYFDNREPPPLPEISCASPEGLAEVVEDWGKKTDATQEELNGIRMQVASLAERIDTLFGSTVEDSRMRAVLPPPFINQVDYFFTTRAAANLLSQPAKGKSVVFSKPVFVSPRQISVPYTIDGAIHYLLVDIQVLDYYDLQFDVAWDSLEGDK